MFTPLTIAISTLGFCWVVHVVIWRFHRPESYPVWFSAIFFGLPLSVVSGWCWFGGASCFASLSSVEVAQAISLHFLATGVYVCSYAGITEYSPSAEILKYVQSAMPTGIAVEKFRLQSFTEDSLTGKRLRHLQDAGIIERDGNLLSPTRRGQIIFHTLVWYRKALGLSEMGRG